VTYTQKPKTLQTEEKIEDSEKKETETQAQEAKSESVCSLEQAIPSETNEKNKETLRVEVINSTETVSNGPESAKSISVSSATKAKAGKYRNLIKVGDKLLQMVMEPSLVEKEAQIQKEKDLEKERLEKEQREKEEEERKKKEDELKLEQLKQEEPVKAKIVN